MTPAQRSAFRGANPGTALTEDALSTAWEAVLAALMVLWVAWVCLHAYKYWSSGREGWGEAAGQVLRAALVTMLILLVLSW